MLSDTDRLTETVEQVLRAGRAGDKKAGREKSAIDFRQLVRECMDAARSRHHLPAEALHYEEASSNGTGPRVLGSGEDLRTAVFNILDNAIKYSGENVDVRVRLDLPDEKRILLSVQDQGVGIPSDDLKSIFKRFYRVSHRSLAHVKGTGLGLFIVKSIAQKHGGKVFAESAGEGHGTTVVLELPRSIA
jgi:signal transduction histidine kinase